MQALTKVKDILLGKASIKQSRSPQWPAVRKKHLSNHSTCAVCNGTKKLEVHHKQPFHKRPDLELDSSNLITLCENLSYGLNCHLLIGHLGSYRDINSNIDKDVKAWHQKLKSRYDK
jgi:5-methylcytosine-specific restriction protein A